ncbi:hypothetical protein HanRHA438_Chr17g0835521 [Helianthus annuus]|nr:hypothetical protein HanRHA438_Chr17g0835521 [Helianthus annuus]
MIPALICYSRSDSLMLSDWNCGCCQYPSSSEAVQSWTPCPYRSTYVCYQQQMQWK